MNVELIKHPTEDDWKLCRLCALNTMGVVPDGSKEVSDEWKMKILRTEHSPIRTLIFVFRLEIPYWVSVHYVRHKVGVEHFVQSQRDDRTHDVIKREDKPQGEMVTHILVTDAQGLINMAHMRLCSKASKETREVMQKMVEEVLKVNPEFKNVLVPKCEYIHDCLEFKPCGRY